MHARMETTTISLTYLGDDHSSRQIYLNGGRRNRTSRNGYQPEARSFKISSFNPTCDVTVGHTLPDAIGSIELPDQNLKLTNL
jgi:hypothetical protein